MFYFRDSLSFPSHIKAPSLIVTSILVLLLLSAIETSRLLTRRTTRVLVSIDSDTQ